MTMQPPADLYAEYLARMRAEPERRRELFREFAARLRAGGPRRAWAPLSLYGEPPAPPPLGAADVARLAKGVALAAARTAAEECVMDAMDALREPATHG